uniref:Uncharacterized protein n=1 Tax=Ananas comosus var. bracteatus TaxID=296719 RepID=A0A6V7PKT8_ANACO|nr:unnamed protein product [Ananas comosus var. bracteatus]
MTHRMFIACHVGDLEDALILRRLLLRTASDGWMSSWPHWPGVATSNAADVAHKTPGALSSAVNIGVPLLGGEWFIVFSRRGPFTAFSAIPRVSPPSQQFPALKVPREDGDSFIALKKAVNRLPPYLGVNHSPPSQQIPAQQPGFVA